MAATVVGRRRDGFARPFDLQRSSTSWTLRTVAASFTEVAEADCRVAIWNVRTKCATNGWFRICVGMVIEILTVLSAVPFGISISDDCSQHKEADENAAWRRQMKRARTPCRMSKIRTTSWNPDGIGMIFSEARDLQTQVELVWLAGGRSASFVGETAARSFLFV